MEPAGNKRVEYFMILSPLVVFCNSDIMQDIRNRMCLLLKVAGAAPATLLCALMGQAAETKGEKPLAQLFTPKTHLMGLMRDPPFSSRNLLNFFGLNPFSYPARIRATIQTIDRGCHKK